MKDNTPLKSDSYIVIGDIHGCIQTLDALLKKISPFLDRTHIFIGDYIDRGPNPQKVVDALLSFSKDHPCVFIRGNHEQMLLDALENEDHQIWQINGGFTTLKSYGIKTPYELPVSHLEFFKQTQLWYETPKYLFIHAGLNPNMSINAQLQDTDIEKKALWERAHINVPANWEKTVVFGHTPLTEPLIADNKIGIDTGCVYDKTGLGKLTAILIPELEIIQQKNIDDLSFNNRSPFDAPFFSY